jgi:hypothetical protein
MSFSLKSGGWDSSVGRSVLGLPPFALFDMRYCLRSLRRKMPVNDGPHKTPLSMSSDVGMHSKEWRQLCRVPLRQSVPTLDSVRTRLRLAASSRLLRFNGTPESDPNGETLILEKLGRFTYALRHASYMDDTEIDRLRREICRAYNSSPHKKKYWLALLEMHAGAEKAAQVGRGRGTHQAPVLPFAPRRNEI